MILCCFHIKENLCVWQAKKLSFNSKVYVQFYGHLLYPKNQPRLIRTMTALLRHVEDGQW